MDLHEVRRLWPNVLEQVKQYRRAVWMMLFESSQVLGVDERTLTIGLRDVGTARAFGSGGKDEIVRQAVIDVLGIDRRIEVVHDPATTTGATERAPAAPPEPTDDNPKGASPESMAAARAAAAAVDAPRTGGRAAAPEHTDDEVDETDASVEVVDGAELIAQQLGGKVIGEIEHA